MCPGAVIEAADARPHDLLWISEAAALIPENELPAWATTAWLTVSPVVVRRAPSLPGDRVPVGVRGAARNERCAAHVAARHVTRKVMPEDIARRASKAPALREWPLPCLRTLARIAHAFDELPLIWGITGSVGFTLASGFDVLRPESDLDLLVRSRSAQDATALQAIAALTRDAESRVDVQVETPSGAFALDEWMRTGGPVLLKTLHGPMLCDDAWRGDMSRRRHVPRATTP